MAKMKTPDTKAKPKAPLTAEQRALLMPMRRLRELTKAELLEVGSLIVKSNHSVIDQIKKSPNASTLHKMIAAVADSVIKDKNVQAFSVLMDRLVGKVKEQVEHSGSIEGMPQVIITLPSNGREVTVNDTDVDDLLG